MKNGFRRIRLISGQADILLKTVVATTIILAAAALISIRMVQWNATARIEALQQEAAELEEENARLLERIEGLDTAEGIRAVAEEELGMVDADTVIVDPE